MINDDSIPSAGANVDSEPKAEVTTSSSNNTKPHVVGSQSEPVSTNSYTKKNTAQGETVSEIDNSKWEILPNFCTGKTGISVKQKNVIF